MNIFFPILSFELRFFSKKLVIMILKLLLSLMGNTNKHRIITVTKDSVMA